VALLIRNGFVAILAGAAVGAVLLGAGGRLVMSIFAIAIGRPSVFTFGGSMSVVLSGAMAGAIGGLLLALVHRFLRGGLWLRGLAFGVVCYLIAVPGFRPPQLLVFGLFAPLFLGYGVATVWAREKWVAGAAAV
jgi:hypothetical protein